MFQKRRSFLKSLGLAGVGLTLTPGTALQAKPTTAKPGQKDLSAVTLSGKVHAGGKGIAGVSITDGINITQTDSSGRYELASNATAEFVYISVPRGYEFTHQNSVTRFYQRIQPSRGRFKADFALEPLSQDDTRHNFVVWADPQIISEADAEELKTKSAPDLRDLVASYPKGTLFHGIGCGDLVWDKFELFEDYKQAIATAGIPFFQVIGNHDMNLEARTDEGSAEKFKELFGPTYYSFNRGEVHYVVLDDVFFIGTGKKYIGYLTEHQLSWLEQDLATVKPGSTVVVNVHIPVQTGATRRDNLKEDPIGGMVMNRKELYRILQPYKAHIMSGHTHFNEKVFEGENLIEHVHGTVCGAWWTGPICYDGTPSGYGVYEVDGSDVKWYYKATGQPKTHQLRAYKPGAVPQKPEHVTANVWNWDPQWKVEWLQDGQNMGPMERLTTLDPLSVELHEGAQKPSKHKWVEPQLTDHMFFAQPAAGARHVTVQATDRFGNVYTEQLELSEQS